MNKKILSTGIHNNIIIDVFRPVNGEGHIRAKPQYSESLLLMLMTFIQQSTFYF